MRLKRDLVPEAAVGLGIVLILVVCMLIDAPTFIGGGSDSGSFQTNNTRFLSGLVGPAYDVIEGGIDVLDVGRSTVDVFGNTWDEGTLAYRFGYVLGALLFIGALIFVPISVAALRKMLGP
jgi:hypothetical protein